MKKAQKIIKYVAIGFGLYLAINIIGWIVFGITMLLGIDVGIDMLSGNNIELVQYDQVFYDVNELDIEVDIVDFEVKVGKELKVEGQIHKNFKIEVENKTLKIEDKSKKMIFKSNDAAKLTLYVPEDLQFNKAKIKIGAGSTNIEKLNVEDLELDLGAGTVEIQNCKTEQTYMKCGAGKVEIKNSSLKNLKLDTGVGEFSYNGYILGNSTIECGIGKLTLDLEGGAEVYSIEAEHGLGEIRLNGNKIEDNKVQGSGENKIKIEGGIGEIQINM